MHPDPNSTFASIQGVHDAQVVAGAIEVLDSESSDAEDHEDVFDCIEVVNLA